MKFAFALIIAFAFICLPPCVRAQAGTRVSGEIWGPNDVPLDGAMIFLLRARDSSVLRTQLSEQDGRFAFEKVQPDTLILLVTNFGFVNHGSGPFQLLPGQEALEMERIELRSSKETQIDEVRITAALPVIERKIDRTVVNVDALITNGGGTAMEALEKSPGITVDQNGLIKLKGKGGVAVFIDDKPTYLSGADLENYLRSLPSAAIKQIEIMPNPPAKYEAAGNAGIINIKTKKNNIQGLNGSLTASYRQGRYLKSNNSLILNFRKNKFNLFTNLNGGINDSYQDLYINRNYVTETGLPESSFRQHSYIKRQNRSVNGKVGIDYYLSDNTTVGVVFKGFWSPTETNTDNIATIYNAISAPVNNVIADNLELSDFGNTTFNANFRHQFDSTGKSLSIDADYVNYFTDVSQFYINRVQDRADSIIYADRLDGNLPSDIRILAFKSDYSHPTKRLGTFSGGIKLSYTQTDNSAIYARTLDGVTAIDDTISNQYIYDEGIGAAYINYSHEIGRFGVQAGLRGESTRSIGNQLGNSVHPPFEFRRDYDNLFPTLYLSYRLDSAANHQLNFSFGKRIDRPFFQDLNPFISPLDKYTYYSGNPFLSPSFTRNLSLAHSFKGNFTTTISYNKSRDEINETLEIRDGIYYSRPGNIGSTELINVSFDATIPFAKWLSTNAYAELGRTKFKSALYAQQLDAEGYYCFFSANNNFTLGKGWSAELSGEYISSYVAAQVKTGDFGFFNVAMKKNLLKDKGSLKVALSDVLYTRRFRGVINNLDNTTADYNSTVDSRVLSLTFNYRFGGNLGEQRKHQGSGSESEQRRVKG